MRRIFFVVTATIFLIAISPVFASSPKQTSVNREIPSCTDAQVIDLAAVVSPFLDRIIVTADNVDTSAEMVERARELDDLRQEWIFDIAINDLPRCTASFEVARLVEWLLDEVVIMELYIEVNDTDRANAHQEIQDELSNILNEYTDALMATQQH